MEPKIECYSSPSSVNPLKRTCKSIKVEIPTLNLSCIAREKQRSVEKFEVPLKSKLELPTSSKKPITFSHESR